MGIENAKTGKLLYHLTKVDNFESIVMYGMQSRYMIYENEILFENVADCDIIRKRTQLGLDKYIPFHFHPYSAFDVAVKNTYDAKRMIYMCIDRELAKANDFKILPKHPLSIEDCVLYDYEEGFEKIDWETLQKKNVVSEYAKEVKMAECLTEKWIPINCFSRIYTPSDEIQKEIIEIMNSHKIPLNDQPGVSVLPVWFDY